MKNSFVMAGIVLLYVVLGLVAAETGLTEPIVGAATSVPDAPTTGGSFLDKLSAALAPIGWAFNAVAGLFQLATYQVDSIPPVVNTLLFAPLGFLLLFAGIRLIRGVGG